ncbi:5,10-methylenetetrahydrofolate reductase [Pseudonocardia sp. Ae168_Ps1]|uniref:methylenetetrahydrofolate reductase n=1 Tax=unclassified Pseudonocardia TaxID=2619320 RepID=UPI00095ED1D2|nr:MULTISPECIES: methylenetetrahydrofolate reductase [unclassified Pseudonocardia]OLL75668.1 5,10-methylenetetrahydrofolate reductase [Pseudonocardia sp. Ae150A_Ps1]OLL81667.1 5,10-methylenetetrahydrofolate reductase [Pseudonocardia sp. Ae168_Ps1]OLL84220.1 5,10-methylenetetrahydrofolate reductase [Pseudonocardia sp. Ae263_Ps1]OLL95762.1 5,10-methylenetetrahydrofolate reductase [Pseudonocardia sp. Ae356_Ps1]
MSDSFLIPDNHIGRATVSSIAVANEVQAMGGNSIACVNSRDRNLLGFRRDLLTAAAYGVDQFLFVQGDKPSVGDRTGELKVRTMVEEARAATDQDQFAGVDPFRLGVTAGHRRRMATWKQAADFVVVQIGYSVDAFLRWRDANPTDLPVYAGVMVLASAGMATRLRESIPDIEIPDDLVDRVSSSPGAGVDAACEQIQALRDTGAFAGAHLVPVSRFRETAAQLERQR